jgi:hypothetical protein
VTLIPIEVLFVYQEVMVCVQLPKSAVQNIEMLIRKVLPHFINILFSSYILENILQVALLEVSESDLAIII